MKKINIRINSGRITADFTGFQGKTCEALEQRIRPEELEVEEKELKPEYHVNAGQTHHETEHNEW